MDVISAMVRSVGAANSTGNWYAALAMTLALPDICSGIENPTAASSKRYAAWFDAHVGERYVVMLGPERERKVFLSGGDCYALRCAFLHEGGDVTALQQARVALDRFHFCEPAPGWRIHNNMSQGALQVQVDIFCSDVCTGVEAWLKGLNASAASGRRAAALLRIYPTGQF